MLFGAILFLGIAIPLCSYIIRLLYSEEYNPGKKTRAEKKAEMQRARESEIERAALVRKYENTEEFSLATLEKVKERYNGSDVVILYEKIVDYDNAWHVVGRQADTEMSILQQRRFNNEHRPLSISHFIGLTLTGRVSVEDIDANGKIICNGIGHSTNVELCLVNAADPLLEAVNFNQKVSFLGTLSSIEKNWGSYARYHTTFIFSNVKIQL